MLEPFLALLADAVDMTATLLVLLAVWEGRKVRGRERLARWLGLRPARPDDVDAFVRAAQHGNDHRPGAPA